MSNYNKNRRMDRRAVLKGVGGVALVGVCGDAWGVFVDRGDRCEKDARGDDASRTTRLDGPRVPMVCDRDVDPRFV